MPRSKKALFRFTKGEWDPQLNGRADLDAYYSSASQLENVFVLPQGGITRRPGMLYRDTIKNKLTFTSLSTATVTAPNGGTTGNLKDDDLSTYLTTTVAIGTTNEYVAWNVDLGSQLAVYFFDIDKVSLITGASTEFVLQYSTDNITYVTINNGIQDSITLDQTERYYSIFVNVTCRYLRLIRIGTTDLGAATIRTAEAYLYLDQGTQSDSTRLEKFQFNDQQVYVLLFSSLKLSIYKNGVLQAYVASPYSAGSLSVIEYTQSNDTAVYCHQDYPPYELKRQGADNLWSFTPIVFSNIPQYNYDPTSTNAANNATLGAVTGVTTLTGNAADIALMGVGDMIVGNGGEARVMKVVSATVVNIAVITPFISTTLTAADTWTILGGYEDLWSATRGYPRCATFYKGRLLLGGFSSRPQTIACSVIDDIYNFDEGQFNDNEAFTITLDSDEANVIYHMVPHDNLEVFASGAEFIISTEANFSPLGKVSATLQSRQGSMQEIRPQDLEEGGTLYVQKGGYSVQEFLLVDSSLAYTNNRLSITASHLIDNPIDASLRKNTSFDESDLYLQVNFDGELIVATIFKGQDILAFTRNITDGSFQNVVAAGEFMYFVTERTNGKYFEQFDVDRLTDCCFYMTIGDSRINGTLYPSASITPSDPQGNGGNPTYLTDDDDSTIYTNTVGISTTNNYVSWQLDLGSNQDVTYINIPGLYLDTGSTSEFVIQTSTDNFVSDITTSGYVIDITDTSQEFNITIGATGRYIRLIRIGTTDLSTAVLSTVEVYVHLDKTVTVSGLDVLDGKNVWTIIDGSVYGPVLVTAGVATIEKDVTVDLEIGLDYDIAIKTNELEDFTTLGSLLGNKKSISEIVVNVYQTQEILVEGYNPFIQTLSQFSTVSSIDTPPRSFTGRYRMVGFRGWNELGQISITQNVPAKLTLLNLAITFNYGK